MMMRAVGIYEIQPDGTLKLVNFATPDEESSILSSLSSLPVVSTIVPLPSRIFSLFSSGNKEVETLSCPELDVFKQKIFPQEIDKIMNKRIGVALNDGLFYYAAKLSDQHISVAVTLRPLHTRLEDEKNDKIVLKATDKAPMYLLYNIYCAAVAGESLNVSLKDIVRAYMGYITAFIDTRKLLNEAALTKATLLGVADELIQRGEFLEVLEADTGELKAGTGEFHVKAKKINERAKSCSSC